MSPPNLETIYDQHAQALFSFLLNLTRSEEDTRDILQDLFIKLAQQPAIIVTARNIRSVLIRHVHNMAIDMFRRRGTAQRHATSVPADEQIFQETAVDEAAFRLELSRSLETLPPDQRVIVHLKLWEQMTFEEIAEALGLSANTAASRYRYGIDKLRTQLRPLYEEIT